MAAVNLVELSDEEREYLVTTLEAALRETRREEHRTDQRDYRVHVQHREQIIESILEKLAVCSA